MRRRSERKKSTDVSSPAPASASRRTSRRSRKSESQGEAAEKSVDTSEDNQAERETPEIDHNDTRGSSEECSEPASARKARSTRNRTPVKERSKRNLQRLTSTDQKIDAIPEEENGSTTNAEENVPIENTAADTVASKDNTQSTAAEVNVVSEVVVAVATALSPPPRSPKALVEVELKTSDVLEIRAEDQEKEKEQELEKEIPKKSQALDAPLSNIAEQPAEVNEMQTNNNSFIIADTAKDDSINREQNAEQLPAPPPVKETSEVSVNSHVTTNDVEKKSPVEAQPLQENNAKANTNTIITTDNGRMRKRKWITKKTAESKAPILSISTDSLKNLIADVHPVPLSDVQLESSSDVEEVVSEREEGEETPSPEREIRRASTDKIEKPTSLTSKRHQNEATTAMPPVQRSPSPARNQASSVLFISNLVRPFTVLQLKGLLARTGKIVEDGFWIDRIKSKCYVQYETEDEAIETRHALHGVRWPVSNPKCLNVDFGKKSDMERAVQSTKEDAPSFGKDNNKDNQIVGTGWNRDRIDADDKKGSRPVREWDVGKKESLDRDKNRERDREVEKRRSRERDISGGNRENERHDRGERDRDRRNRSRGRGEPRSSSVSPARKVKKKENDPPLRLLDDLFRKTKATPSIYWLPLTPEQIAEKEAFRQKRIEEHKQRIKQRELERGKEREKERNRVSDRGGRERDRDRADNRRNRSNDRRSRSRDRRRY